MKTRTRKSNLIKACRRKDYEATEKEVFEDIMKLCSEDETKPVKTHKVKKNKQKEKLGISGLTKLIEERRNSKLQAPLIMQPAHFNWENYYQICANSFWKMQAYLNYSFKN